MHVTPRWIGVTMKFVADRSRLPMFLIVLAYDLLGGTGGCGTSIGRGGVVLGFEAPMFVLG